MRADVEKKIRALDLEQQRTFAISQGLAPQEAADALFATDNFKAGLLIGQYAKAVMASKPAKKRIL